MKSLTLSVLLLCASLMLGQSTVPSTFWGIHFNSQSTLSSYPSSLTFNTIRLWDTGTGWYEMQSGAACDNTHTGGCNFTNLDSWMSVLPSGVDIILTIGKTPHFISSDPTDSCAYSQSGHCVPPSDIGCGAGTDATFIGFVQALWNHMMAQTWYSGRQWYVEIWNEPNNASFWDNSYISTTLCPSTTDAPQVILARMAQDARTYISAKDSSVKFLTPPVANARIEVQSGGWWYKYLGYGGSYADIMSVHGYLSSGDSVDKICCGSGTLVSNTLSTMSTLGYGSNPLFVSEGSYATSSPSDPAAWTARYYTLLLSGGSVARFGWYNYDSSPAKLWDSGTSMLTTTGSALDVLQNDWGYLGATFAAAGCTSTAGTCSSVSGNLRACALTEGGGTSAKVVWFDAPVSTPCSYSAGAGWSDYRDISNNVVTYTGSVPLSNSPIELEQ